MTKRPRAEDVAYAAAAEQEAAALKAEAEEVIGRISEAAAGKRLSQARAAYAELAARGLPDSLRARTAVLHAHVNAGDREGAWQQLDGIKQAGFTPNVVVFTALLKADALAGDVRGAGATLGRMLACRPRPVLPDARACNTYLRCCLRCGDAGAASRLYARMADEWECPPDATTYRLLARLLAQALRLEEAKALAKRHREQSVTQTQAEGAPEEEGGRDGGRLGDAAPAAAAEAEGAPPLASWQRKQVAAKWRKQEWRSGGKGGAAGGKGRSTPQCMFWQRGRCDRGNSCRFYHDPALAPQLVAELMLEKHAAAVEVELAVASAAAGLGEWGDAREALERAGTARQALDEAAARDAALTQAFDRMKQAEIDAELKRLTDAAIAADRKSAKRLAKFLRNCFLFYPEPLEAQAQGGGGGGEGTREALLRSLRGMLEHTVGLAPLVACGAADADGVAARLEKCVSKAGRLRWGKIFKERGGSDAPLPVRLEICSGSGDWVVAQALADAGRAHWAALELRHDRVCHIVQRALTAGAASLCVLGGDASAVLPRRIKKRSVDHAYINFPEPPHHTGDARADNRHHLLTSSFFRDIHAALKPGGRLTINSDNRVYCEALCETLGVLGGEDEGGHLFEPVHVEGARAEVRQGVRVPLLCDLADCRAAGHAVAAESYFDRFWRNGGGTERVWVVVKAL